MADVRLPMNLVRILKLLIALEIGFIVLAIVAGIWLQDSLPDPLHQYLAAENNRELRSVDIWVTVFSLPVFGLLIASWIGLWKMRKWSRAAYTTAWGLSILAVPLLGPSVMHGFEYMLGDIANLVAGMILSMIWFSPLSSQFRPKLPNSALHTDATCP
jgi:hypothetical protein